MSAQKEKDRLDGSVCSSEAAEKHIPADSPPTFGNKTDFSVPAARTDTVIGHVCVSADEYQEFLYSRQFERELIELEHRLHNAEDPMEISIEVLKTACRFYEADWAGVLLVDMEAAMWRAEVWYDVQKGSNKRILIEELEYSDDFSRWVKCLKESQPVIIENCDTVSDPAEHRYYKNVGAKSILAVPFWKHPTGFLVLKNPRQHISNSHMLQVLAYVAMLSTDRIVKIKSIENIEKPTELKTDKDIMINVLGGLEIITAYGRVSQEKLNSEKGCKLITLLLLSQKPVQPWDIVNNLWPNDPAKDPMGNLRSLIHSIRTKLDFIMDDYLIVASGHGYTLNPDYNIISDFTRFEKLVSSAINMPLSKERTALLITAFNLYKGNLLPAASGEHWIIAESAHYSTLYIKLVDALLDSLDEEKELLEIRDFSTRSLKIEPGNIHAYLYLIKTFLKTGSIEIAKQELIIAKQYLSEEDYLHLVDMLTKGGKDFPYLA